MAINTFPDYPLTIPILTIKNNYYDLSLQLSRESLSMRMFVKLPFYTTSHLPYTVAILQRELPCILKCQCFNRRNLPFIDEVRNTELAHLFEHIFLEYLCDLKYADSSEPLSYSGLTTWNWGRDPIGTFYIEINADTNDYQYVIPAIERTNQLMMHILETNNTHLLNQTTYFPTLLTRS